MICSMNNFIHYRNLSRNHIARSVIITPSNEVPSFMSYGPFQGIGWPTPATKAYKSVVNVSFTKFYFAQDTSKRDILLNAVTHELFHEGGGRVYKRVSGNPDILMKQSRREFQHIIKKRLVNLRHLTVNVPISRDYDAAFAEYARGEKVMVSLRSSAIYEGIFQFVSIINSDYCYIEFDSRQHIVRWERRYVTKIDLSENGTRRITRQMSKRQRTVTSTTETLPNVQVYNSRSGTRPVEATVLSDNSTESEDDSVEPSSSQRTDLNNNVVETFSTENNNQNLVGHTDEQGRGVAVGGLSHGSDVPESTGGDDYDSLLALLGDGTENKTKLDDKWLSKQGFTSNQVPNYECSICLENLPLNEIIYDIKCNGVVRHPIHMKCVTDWITKGGTTCPACRDIWE